MRPAALGAFLDGVAVIERIAGGLADRDWACPTPCPDWTVADLAGHIRCAAEDYNAVLEGALGSGPGPVLQGADLAEHNAARLAALPPAAPLVHVAVFGLDARRFAERAAHRWDATVFGVRGSAWTVGDYVGFCALEWHLHAWDLASGAGFTYRPRCVRTLAGWWRQRLPHVPLDADCVLGDCSWAALLRASGRAPAASGPSLRRTMADSKP